VELNRTASEDPDVETPWVEIEFDCLPLRSVTRLDVPLDASPRYREFVGRVKDAMDKHGTHNSYYLYRARCVYHLTNRPGWGTLEFSFEGTVLTDAEDRLCRACDLDVRLVGETCEWLTAPVVDWFRETVPRTAAAEFDRYIEAGDLQKARIRLEQMEQAVEEAGGFLGMYL
jgi:hypothetical protein